MRWILLTIGVLVLAAGAFAAVVTQSTAGLPAAVFGGGLLLALLIERRRYKRIQDRAPGPDWQPTGERFIDPGSDTSVAVYFQPHSGKRAYVRTGRS